MKNNENTVFRFAGMLFPKLWDDSGQAVAFCLQTPMGDYFLFAEDKLLKKMRKLAFHSVTIKGKARVFDHQRMINVEEILLLDFCESPEYEEAA